MCKGGSRFPLFPYPPTPVDRADLALVVLLVALLPRPRSQKGRGLWFRPMQPGSCQKSAQSNVLDEPEKAVGEAASELSATTGEPTALLPKVVYPSSNGEISVGFFFATAPASSPIGPS